MKEDTIEDKRNWSIWKEWVQVTTELNRKWDLSTVYITCEREAEGKEKKKDDTK